MPDAHGGFQDLRTRAKPEALHGFPQGLTDHRRREVGVRGRGARRVVFFRGQVLPHLAGGLRPVAARIRMEDIRQGAPAAVAGEDSLLVFGWLPVFVFDQPEGADRRDVVAGLFLLPALPDPVRLVYPEVPRRRPRFLRGDVVDLDVPDFDVPDGEVSAGGWFPLW